MAKMATRLQKGHEEYGDQSFKRPAGELWDEIEEEILDIIGWAFVRWCQLQDRK